MAKTRFTIVVKEADIHLRKRWAPQCKVFRDRTRYSRKTKHKGTAPEAGIPS